MENTNQIKTQHLPTPLKAPRECHSFRSYLCVRKQLSDKFCKSSKKKHEKEAMQPHFKNRFITLPLINSTCVGTDYQTDTEASLRGYAKTHMEASE